MKIERIKINNIPSIIWGEKSNKVYMAVHGNMSNKEEQFNYYKKWLDKAIS